MKPTASNLIRWAGLSAVAAGVLFVVVQIIHPLDRLAAVPMGLALAGLGLAVWAGRREPAAQEVPGSPSTRLRRARAE